MNGWQSFKTARVWDVLPEAAYVPIPGQDPDMTGLPIDGKRSER